MGAGRAGLGVVLGLVAASCVLLAVRDASGVVYEYSNKRGRVTHYKYVDRKGSVVFTDSLSSIPLEYQKQGIVRVGPPTPKEPPPEEKPAPPPPPAPPPVLEPLSQAFPVEKPKEPPPTNWTLVIAVVVAALAGIAGAFFYLRRKGTPAYEAAAGRRPAPAPRPERRPAPVKTEAPPPLPADRQQAAIKHFLLEKDFASAAKLAESLGEFEKAAGYYREAGDLAKAGQLFAAQRDYRSAGEVYEAAGDLLKAAELFEAASKREDHETGPAAGGSALRSGRLYEKAGLTDRALAIYLKGKRFAEAGRLCEGRQDFLQAAEYYLKGGDAEKAAFFFEKGGDTRKGNTALSAVAYERGHIKEAAGYAEKAGDPMRAAELYQEAQDYAKAGELFSRAGLFSEAADNYFLANDAAAAAAAFEKAGRYLEAAQAVESLGGDPLRVAELFEKGLDFYAAGRSFLQVGSLDRALNALQRVEPDSEYSRSAAVLIGTVFLRQGQTDLAREKFLKIIDNQPVGKTNLDAYYFLAISHLKTGDQAKAREIFSRILVEDYAFRDVKRRMDKPVLDDEPWES